MFEGQLVVFCCCHQRKSGTRGHMKKAQEPLSYTPHTTNNRQNHLSPLLLGASGLCHNRPSQWTAKFSISQHHVIVPSAVDDSDSMIQSVHSFIDRLHDQFGSWTTLCARIITGLQNVQTGKRKQWGTLLHSVGGAVPLHPLSVVILELIVEASALPVDDHLQLIVRRKDKRPRHMNYNVRHNQPNAKA